MKLHNLNPYPCFTFSGGEATPGARTEDGLWSHHAYLGAEGELYGSVSDEEQNQSAIVVVHVPTKHYSQLRVDPHVTPIKEEVVDHQTVATFLVEKGTGFTIRDQRESSVLFIPEQTYSFTFDGSTFAPSPPTTNSGLPFTWKGTSAPGVAIFNPSGSARLSINVTTPTER